MEKNFDELFKTKLLETFHRFVTFLNSHNISYWACGGTCLGAVRHHNIIPWDDDIDIFMLREDMDRLYELRDELNSLGFKYEYIEDYGFNHSYAKVYDSNTTIWEQKHQPIISGLWIDIYVLYRRDGGTEGLWKVQAEFAKKYMAYHRGALGWSLPNLIAPLVRGGLTEFYQRFMSMLFNKRKYNDFMKFEHGLNQNNGANYVSLMGIGAYVYNHEWFDDFIDCPFSDFSIRIPKAYHEYLTYTYGNYMQLPPIEKRVNAHQMYYVNLSEGLSLKEVKKRITSGEYRKR